MMNFYERYDLSEGEGIHYNLSKLKNRQKHGVHQGEDDGQSRSNNLQNAWDSYELDAKKKQLVQMVYDPAGTPSYNSGVERGGLLLRKEKTAQFGHTQ